MAGVNGTDDLQLRIVAAAGALVGIGPAAVEDILALRMRFQIAGHDADDLVVESSRSDAGRPSRCAAWPSRSFQPLRKRRAIRRGYSRALKRRVGNPAAGLAQAFQSSAGIALIEETASRVISDEAIDTSNIVHRACHFKTAAAQFRFSA